jgi:adenine-specific DNA-methyltransferase
MVYFDPPYGIKYGSNFQPFVNKRDVKDGKDEDLTAEPEMVKAFRDTWELGLHSYLSYLRDRLLLARELLHESGSVFMQIGDENVHHVREILDEVFGAENFVCIITVSKTSGLSSPLAKTLTLTATNDFLVWYARDTSKIKYRQLFRTKTEGKSFVDVFKYVQLKDGTRRLLTSEEASSGNLPDGGRLYALGDSTSQKPTTVFPFEFQGKVFNPGKRGWRTTKEGMERIVKAERFVAVNDSLRYVQFAEDFPVSPINSLWEDTGTGSFLEDKVYVVQTGVKVVQRCLLMTTDPGDLVLDITCGSGTTAYVAEQWGRRWMTCDTSRVALTLAKQRLMTAVFPYYQLAHEAEGVDSGFRYTTVPHVTLKSIAKNEPPGQETLYDQPLPDASKLRVTGPFTVEAVPAPTVKSPAELSGEELAAPQPADESVARAGETVRQSEWRSELLRSGIRAKKGQMFHFSRVEPLSGTRWLHADAETKGDRIERAVISFGPEHAPLEQKQVEMALEEARKLVPRPPLIFFAAFQFDPEAAKDIDELNWPGVTVLKAQMNADLLTEDLKRARSSNESFWLIGQPDVMLRRSKQKPKDPKDKTELWELEIKGFDYYNTRTGQIISGDAKPKPGEKDPRDYIAVWMLDTDYDGRSLFPRQVFFPMAGEKEGWAKLAKNLKAEIDESLIEAYRGTVSLPFAAGKHGRVAVKIVDDRGIESLKILDLP